MAVVEVSIIPLGTGSPSVSRFVARALDILSQEKGLKYELTPMGTIIEGDLDLILTAITKMHRSAFGEGSQRVVTTIKIDERRDKAASLAERVESVKSKMRVR